MVRAQYKKIKPVSTMIICIDITGQSITRDIMPELKYKLDRTRTTYNTKRLCVKKY